MLLLLIYIYFFFPVLKTSFEQPNFTKPLLSRFSCKGCGRHYKYKKGLFQHLRYECGKEPQFGCVLCTYKCKQKGALASHIKYKHSK